MFDVYTTLHRYAIVYLLQLYHALLVFSFYKIISHLFAACISDMLIKLIIRVLCDKIHLHLQYN